MQTLTSWLDSLPFYLFMSAVIGGEAVLIWQQLAERRRLKRQLAALRDAPVCDEEWETEP